MTPQDFLAVLATGVLALLFYISFIKRVGQRPKDCPPGPPTLPIIGNLHQMPRRPEESGQHFEKWARQYGPIYSLILGTNVWIVICKDWAVKELLDKRGAIYSSRPDNYLAQDIFSGGLRAFFIKDGAPFKRNRKLGRIHLNEKVSRTYIPYQDLENKAMLVGFLDSPALFIDHIQRFTTSFAMQLTYGFRVLSEDDPVPKKLLYLFDCFSTICFSTTATLLESYPLLRQLPDLLVPAKRRARKFHQMEREVFLGLHRGMKEKIRMGTAPPCFSRELARVQEEEHMSDEEAAYTSGSLLQASLGSTFETLTGFVQAIVLFPNVSQAAQAELDRVCGDHIPDLDDWSDLRYVRGCIKEALRWMPASPLGIPHALTCNDEYMGYQLPKGATVILNVRAIHNDPERYPDPRIFDPMRWADDDQTSAQAATNADVTQRDHFGFGAGRRLCQGMHIAERSLFLAVSRLLWAFDFQPGVDPITGHEMPMPDPDDLQGGMFVMPRPFPAKIVPRDAEKAGLVREAWKEISCQFLDQDSQQWKVVPEMSIWPDQPDHEEQDVNATVAAGSKAQA